MKMYSLVTAQKEERKRAALMRSVTLFIGMRVLLLCSEMDGFVLSLSSTGTKLNNRSKHGTHRGSHPADFKAYI